MHAASILTALALAGCSTAHGVHAVGSLQIHTFRRDWANAHVVVGPGGTFLVDAGYERNTEAFEADLRAVGLDPSTFRAVILTHGHADHAGGARYFKERYGIPIVAGRDDHPILSTGRNPDELCPTNDDARGRRAADQGETFQPVAVDALIEEARDLSELAGVPGRIVPLAGHTPGSLIVVVEGAAFVGDLFRGDVFSSGAEVHYYMCDLEDNHADVRELLTTHAPDAELFFPGHFGPLTRAAVDARFADRE